MKRILTLLMPLALLFSSCQKNEYIEAVPNRTIIVNIAPTAWRTTDGGRNYSTSLNMPEITNDFNERGGVLLYLSFGERTYEQLPEVYNGIAYGFTTSPGQINLEMQDADDNAVIPAPVQTITAKIVLVESEYQ
jgi:hypothetical protein